MTPIEWALPAIEDLEAVVDYIARDSRAYAGAVAERILTSVDSLQSFPRSGRVVPEARDPKIREILVQSYRIVYRLHRGRVQILAIVHGARDFAMMKPRPWEVIE